MPAKGKHRRIKSNRLTRGIAAAGTGGAVVALPLLGATGAHAAEQAAPAAAPGQAVTAAAQVKAPAVVKAAPAAAKAAPKTYSVVRGDYLSKIAAEHHLTGGWQKLYADNRQVVGENPSLILPGMKLTLGAKSTAKAAAPKSAAPKAAAPKSSEKNGDTSRASRSSERSAAPAASTPSADTSAAQTSKSSGAATSASGWFAPVSGGMSTPYRAAGSMWSSGYHTGVDFMASTGTTIVAVGPGTVYSAGDGGAYGNQVVIQHADGTFSQYAHLSSISVSAGQTVSGGEQIGLSGATGNVTGPHLHFEIRTGPDYGSDIDPIAALRQHGVNI
ncbi:LysM peptidoglycan-binding domain-containing M23 family metallopeptidase [Streptomyces sp. NBC_00233]|uniref:LysM peptidoglycan-binding domain-containing M23 family metallopeptidase n=1 Tax=Streptomyces sp. NBC_00233 TaxID=2975686 RepID=UPI002258F188|nr:LysM peptidoglycan-binding domain-containing M23 family metallopeptidase [Streptomyces sp. NBC_00233]MCX5229966.1 LysM peptidoglycan-binding domain-containing M23 family metallopeptidase [Streptomyces sp. NBC_00233]